MLDILTSKNSANFKQYQYFHAKFLEEKQYKVSSKDNWLTTDRSTLADKLLKVLYMLKTYGICDTATYYAIVCDVHFCGYFLACIHEIIITSRVPINKKKFGQPMMKL